MLIVTLHPSADTSADAGAYALDHDLAYAVASAGFALNSQGTASLALLPKAEQTILLVPAVALSWHKIDLPKLPRGTAQTKLRAVLDGLMEDRVLDDTDKLHLALFQQKRSDGTAQHWVAACNKAWLATSLQDFRAAGHHVVSIAPQSMPWSAASQPLGTEPNSAMRNIHFSGTMEDASVCICDADGVLNLPAQAAQALLVPLAEPVPEYASAEPVVAAAAEALVSKLLPDARVVIRSSAQHAVQAVHMAQAAGCDLAQFDMSLAGSARWVQKLQAALRDAATLPAWRPARIGLVAVVAAQIVGLNAWAFKEKSNLADKRASVQQILTQTFPQVKVVVDAPVQMQREVAALSQASGALTGRDMELLLARFSALNSTNASTNSAPAAIDFVAGELGVKGSGIKSDQLPGLLPKLQAAGINASIAGDRLVITEAKVTDRVASSLGASSGTSTSTSPAGGKP